MDISQLRYLIALARERHFARAAEASSVTQPTLSMRIRQLEEELGVPLVRRGNRFQGLTAEGERILAWAGRIVNDWDNMQVELGLRPDDLEGMLTVGVIPSALPRVPELASALRARHPRIRMTVLSRSSVQIEREMDSFAMDAGVTYLDNEPIGHRRTLPLYRESYCVFLREDHALAGREGISWAEAADLPLCLLTPDMQNRRIIDSTFAQAGRCPVPEVESNSVLNLCAFVQAGELFSVLPDCFLSVLGQRSGLRAVPLVAPSVEHLVGLVAPERDPLPPLVAALLKAARDVEAFGERDTAPSMMSIKP
jgi:DNA-binding transcriptional LysR family regulator